MVVGGYRLESLSYDHLQFASRRGDTNWIRGLSKHGLNQRANTTTPRRGMKGPSQGSCVSFLANLSKKQIFSLIFSRFSSTKLEVLILKQQVSLSMAQVPLTLAVSISKAVLLWRTVCASECKDFC